MNIVSSSRDRFVKKASDARLRCGIVDQNVVVPGIWQEQLFDARAAASGLMSDRDSVPRGDDGVAVAVDDQQGPAEATDALNRIKSRTHQ